MPIEIQESLILSAVPIYQGREPGHKPPLAGMLAFVDSSKSMVADTLLPLSLCDTIGAAMKLPSLQCFCRGLVIPQVLFTVACTDQGPRAFSAHVAVSPVFQGVSESVDAASLHIVALRADSMTVATDTTVSLSANQDSVDVAVSVPLEQPTELLFIHLDVLDANDQLLFQGVQVITVTAGARAAAPAVIPLSYVGTGANAVAVVISTPAPVLPVGGTLALVAIVIDSADAPIPGTPIRWASRDSSVVRVTDEDLGSISGVSAGTAWVVATLLTGHTDSALVTVTSGLPSQIVHIVGDGQTGSANTPVAQPPTVRIDDAAGNPIAGVSVDWVVVSGGGAVTGSPSITNALGITSVGSWTLGSSSGIHQLEARVMVGGQNPTLLTLGFTATVPGPAGRLPTVRWTNPSGGSWETATNWDTGVVPGPNDSVVIDLPGTYTITVGQSTQIAALDFNGSTGVQTIALGSGTFAVDTSGVVGPNGVLQISGGTLGGVGPLLVDGTFDWTGGRLTGVRTVSITNLGTGILSGGLKDLISTAILNFGTLTWSVGDIRVGSAALIQNQPSGTFNVTGDVAITNSFGGAVSNLTGGGVFMFSASNVVNIGIPFSVTNGFSVFSGDVNIQAGGSLSGVVTLATGSDLLLTAGTITLSDGLTVQNGPTVLQGATVTNGVGETATFSELQQTSGTVGGGGDVVISSLLTFGGGRHEGAGRTLLPASASAVFAGGPFDLVSRTFENHGTLDWQSGDFRGGSTATMINAPSGTITLNFNPSFSNTFGGGNPTFDNQGTITHSVAANTNVAVPFTNSGTLDVQVGTFTLVSTSTFGGAPAVSPGALIVFNGGTHTLVDGFTLSGPVQLASGVLTIASGETATFGNFTQSGGTVDGAGTFVLPSVFMFTGGRHQGAGVTRLGTAAMGTFNGGPFDLVARTFENQGTLNWQAGNFRGGSAAQLLNASTGTINLTSNPAFTNTFGGSNPTFNNAGSIIHNVAANTNVAIPFTNGGTLDVQSGTFTLTSTSVLMGAPTVSAGAAFVFNGGTHTLGDGFVVTGPVQLASGTLTNAVGETATFADFTQSGGTIDGAGTFVWPSAFLFTGGSHRGTGLSLLGSSAAGIIGSGPFDLITRTFENQGTLDWQAGNFRGGSAATLLNASTGTINFSVNPTFSNVFGGANPTVNNQGTINYGAAANATMALPFVNSGTLDIQSGTFTLTSTGSWSGSPTVAVGASLTFNGGVHTLADGFVVTGLVQLISGTLSNAVGETATFVDFVQSGGTINGAGTFVWSSVLTFSGGQHQGSGLSLLGPSATGTISSGPFDLIARTFENQGVLDWQAGNFRGGSAGMLLNGSTGTINFSTNPSFSNTFGGANPTVNNQGTIIYTSAANASMGVPFTTSGTFDVQSGSMTFSSTGTWSGSPTVSAGAALIFVGGVHTLADGFSVTGEVQVGGGTLTNGLSETASFDVFSQTGGTVSGAGFVVINGSFALSGGQHSGSGSTEIGSPVIGTISGNLDIITRSFTNLGTITWSAGAMRGGTAGSFVNAGTLRITHQLSLQNTFGGATPSFTVTPGGTIEFEATANMTSGAFTVGSATLTLDGTVRVIEVGGYVSTIGDVLNIITDPSGLRTGTFATVDPNWNAFYTGDPVTLVRR